MPVVQEHTLITELGEDLLEYVTHATLSECLHLPPQSNKPPYRTVVKPSRDASAFPLALFVLVIHHGSITSAVRLAAK